MITLKKILVEQSSHIPRPLLNSVLLAFPILYRINLINYESALGHKIEGLLKQLSLVTSLNGSIIECGSFFCGTSIIMANYLRLHHTDKIIYACDSFEGFAVNELEKEKKGGLTKESGERFKTATYAYVKRKIKRLGSEGMVIPVKGYFEDTLPGLKAKYCFAFVDCDLQESTLYCLNQIWPHIIPDGRIVIDDYAESGYRGVKSATDNFVNKHQNQISEHGILYRHLYYIRKDPQLI